MFARGPVLGPLVLRQVLLQPVGFLVQPCEKKLESGGVSIYHHLNQEGLCQNICFNFRWSVLIFVLLKYLPFLK